MKAHVSSILAKLHLADRTQAAIFGLQQRLVPLDTKYRYQPASSVLDRLTFHFSIGEAF